MFPPLTNPFSTGSPLPGLLGQAPRTVQPPEPPPVEPTESEAVQQSQTPLLSGLWGSQPQAEPERLTADEIRARAEVQARTYGALILLLNAVIECVKASMTLKKGEYAMYLDLKIELNNAAKQGIINIYESDPQVKDIWEKGQRFDETLEALEDDTELDEAEGKLLFKAIKADLERKNRRNELNDDSVAGTVLKLILTRQMSSMFELITLFTRKRAARS